ncbi:GNAT family N-acetyltransferase [Phycisphaera mikurensis]|uniref:Putative acetyltransferase n=1 Tax=Phycisphaera mikurensis (strain NBRC 102666 / KCTC 22515 / FYK2301M01) TaxID=1142394 RepID=I0IBU0_PHYMF|nr:GNAT family N-acetyltransferase [Phycisphaera mikurensis]MBB6442044.1 ribosomal protein S18 acetylase RimI-like enzyme [Phycisphaera mikurensis]BAM02728.1 putative acetyltransferase [Phycisphaera mikurensis NBRC 102666]
MEASPAPGSRSPRTERERRRAAAVLLLGRAGRDRESRSAAERFLAYAEGQRLAVSLRTADAADGRPLAVAALAGPGRAAMVLVSPMRGPDAGPVARMLDDLVGGLGGVRVAQALPEPERDAERAALAGAGFETLATLVYLEGAAEPAREDPLPGVGAGWVQEQPWSPAASGRFAAAIECSYAGTLDCPGLIGRRPIEEVIEGHRGAGGPGAFAARRWRVWSDPAGPVAVLLLARLPQEPTLEVVYLGVAPRARGRGIGRLLLRRAQAEAARSGAERVVLAADAANRPALRVYRSAGFRSVQRRLAMARFRPLGAEGAA